MKDRLPTLDKLFEFKTLNSVFKEFVDVVLFRMSSQDMKTAIHMKLVQTGEKEKLKEHLRMRLIECGWRDQVQIKNYKT